MDLTAKYRPGQFNQVIGQDATVKSLKEVLKQRSKRAFCFHGPSGTGKTTLARIVASKVGCLPSNVQEIDGASHTGVDDMREITEKLQYTALGSSPVKVVILDEAHMLSRSAWNSLLKSIEEPPAHVFWCICTTEFAKVPDTIRTRCSCYALHPVDEDQLFEMLKSVAAAEGYTTPDEVLYVIAQKSQGSPRRSLTYLAQAHTCQNRKEAVKAVGEIVTEDPRINDICEGMLKGFPWEAMAKILKGFEKESAEGIRIAINSYLAKVLLDSKSEDRAQKVATLMQPFKSPFPSGNHIYPVALAVVEAMYSE